MLSLVVKEYREGEDDSVSFINCPVRRGVDEKLSTTKRLEWMRKFNYSCRVDDSKNKWRELGIKKKS